MLVAALAEARGPHGVSFGDNLSGPKATASAGETLMRLLGEGLTVRDTYEVERFLGEGAFAEVYRAKHRFLGSQAMKVFKRVGIYRQSASSCREVIFRLAVSSEPQTNNDAWQAAGTCSLQ